MLKSLLSFCYGVRQGVGYDSWRLLEVSSNSVMVVLEVSWLKRLGILLCDDALQLKFSLDRNSVVLICVSGY